ncbi:MAG: hypothetical protein DCF26_04525 [Burkholderiales bacterium]|nr:MAG: hypothetical protein DCF26_04525 [Burkholderiales bacterium]
MNQKQFEQLCLDACTALGLKDTGALGAGFPATIDGVDVELILKTSAPVGLQMILEVGAPDPEHRLQAYEAVLSLQALWMGDLQGMFALDAAADRLLFVLTAPVAPTLQGAALALVIRGLAAQVLGWRHTVLKDKLDLHWLADGAPDPAAAVDHV